jgi:hypothetical protein
MKIFKTRLFDEWAKNTDLTDINLIQAVQEMNSSLIDVNLGGNLYKKRVSVGSQGKSGSLRTLIAFKIKDKAFFVYGFAKNKKANITDKEKKALKIVAKNLFGHSENELTEALNLGLLIEVEQDG